MTLTELALREYGLETAKTAVLQDLGNLVCRVTAEDGQDYALRIYASPGATEAEIASELAWATDIHERTGLTTTLAVPNSQGERISRIAAESGERFAVLFEWVEGVPSSKRLNAEIVREIGRTAARLHRAAREFTPPPGFTRPRWDWNRLCGPASWFGSGQALQDVGPDAYATLARTAVRLRTVTAALGEGSERFGLIHSDLHFGNFILRDDDAVQVIDFDDCAWGWFAFDIAVVLGEVFDDPQTQRSFREAFLGGYQDIAPLPVQHLGQLDLIRAANAISYLQWVFTAPNPAVRREKMRWVPNALADLETIAKTQGDFPV